MDARLRSILQSKIDTVIRSSDEIFAITRSLGELVDDEEKTAFGIALGRLYNAFHYQTRRVLKRDATNQELGEFIEMLSGRAAEIKQALQASKQLAK